MIRNLQIKNWKCHDILSLELKEGVNFIIGFNGIGKTSILEAIVFGLIGRVRTKPLKTFKKIGSSEDAEVSLRFEQKEREYEIIRSFNGRASRKLLRPPEQDLTNLDDIKDFILDLFDSNQAFLENILYSPEGEIYNFLRLDSKNLVNYLEKLIGIGKMREFKNLINNLRLVFEKKRKEYKNYVKTLKDFEIKEALGDRIQLEGDKNLLHNKSNALKSEIKNKKNEISQIEKKKDEIYGKNYDYRILLSKTEKIYNQNREFFQELNIGDFSIQEFLSKKGRIVNVINNYSKKLKSKVQECKDKEKEILEKKLRLEERHKIKAIIDKLKMNYEVETKVVCPLCKKLLSKNEFLLVHEDTIDEIDTLEEEIDNIKKNLKNDERARKDLNIKYNTYRELMDLLESISKFDENTIMQIEDKIQKFDKEIAEKRKELQKLDDSQSFLDEKLKEIKDKLRDIKAAEKVKDVMKYDKKFKENYKGTLICDITLEALEKVLKKQRNLNLDDLVDEIKKIWKVFFPYEDRNLYFDKNYIPYFEKKSETIPFKNASGGEKIILLVLIKTILLKKYTKIPFLILDEPLEHLNFENRINIIDYLIEIHRKGLIKQLIITTFEESLTRKFRNSDKVNIISLPNIKKYKG